MIDWMQQDHVGKVWRMKCLDSWVSRNHGFRDRWQVGMATPLKDYLVGALDPRPEQRSYCWTRIEPRTGLVCEDRNLTL